MLDLGSGGGIDVLLSARRVGPAGKAYGLDMTDEMLELARRNQQEAGVDNAEFLRGTIEEVPLPDDSVDVIISNCVINLSGDKPAVFREAARVLRPGGRLRGQRRGRGPRHGRGHPPRHGAVDRLHRGRPDPRGFRARAARRPDSRTSRSARRIACTTRPSRRSSGPACRDDHRRDPAQRPTDALPALGGPAVEPVRHRPVHADKEQWPRMSDERPRPHLLGAVVADGRRGADHDQVLGPGRRLRQRGGGDLPRHPAGRRGAPHAVLRALPGRGDRRARRDRRSRRAGARAGLAGVPARSSTRRWSRRTRRWSPRRATSRPRSAS